MFERVKLVRKENHVKLAEIMEQEIAAAETNRLEQQGEIDRLNVMNLDHQERSSRRVTELMTKLSEAEVARNEADERTRVAEDTCARVTTCHSTRVRIGSIPIFDAIGMTARIRMVEGSLRCETDGKKIVAYGDRQITEAEWNALVETSTPQWDRT